MPSGTHARLDLEVRNTKQMHKEKRVLPRKEDSCCSVTAVYPEMIAGLKLCKFSLINHVLAAHSLKRTLLKVYVSTDQQRMCSKLGGRFKEWTVLPLGGRSLPCS